MNMTTVKLTSFTDEHIKSVLFAKLTAHKRQSSKHIDQAIKAQKTWNLRYNNNNGKMYGQYGLNECPSNSIHHVPHETEEDIIEWEFARELWNSADRLLRGFSA